MIILIILTTIVITFFESQMYLALFQI